MYNKLFTKILDSSIWLESMPTRIVWLTIIAAMDEHGFAQFASVANIAHRARVSVEDAEAAITCLESPDPNSSDPDNDGRRVERVPGGWLVLNAEKHRTMVTKVVIQERTRERVRRHRERKQSEPVTNGNSPVTPSNAPVTLGNKVYGSVTPSEAVSKAKAEEERTHTTPLGSFMKPQRGYGPGAGAGTYPRDHLAHAFCGRFCVSATTFQNMSRRYGDGGNAAVLTFLEKLSASLGPNDSPGGPLWVLQHFDAWLIEIGRVPAAPVPAKPGVESADERRARMIASAEAKAAKDDARRAAR